MTAHHLVLIVLGVLILALLGALAWHLTRKKPSPGPDTVIRRALSASEVQRDALRIRHSGSPHVAKGPGQVKMPGVVAPTQVNIPVPPPRPAPYARLRESNDRRIAAETTELAAISPEMIAADRNQLLLVAQQATPVSTAPPTSPLDMTVAQLMEQIEREARQAAAALPLQTDRRIHAQLADGTEVVRYERAGKWFHEGPGLRTRLTLGQAAILATSQGALVRSGLPGGAMFDLRVRKVREEQG